MKVRLKFTKGNEVKYISHLDLTRVFQRAIRRTGIPISYSSGFNPHQEISFGAPLSLGITSNAEYVDLRLDEPMEIPEIIRRLNGSLPEGIRILDGTVLGENAKSAMSAVTHAKYSISMEIENIAPDALEKCIQAFASQEHIIVAKEQPKKNFQLKEIDIRPMIVDMKFSGTEGGMHVIECLLLSGSRANLNPELLIKAFREFTGYNIAKIRINREEVYALKDGRLADMLEYER